MADVVWAPTLPDVAHHLRHFTVDANGAPVTTVVDGTAMLTFDASTAPSASDVVLSIDATTDDVLAATGPIPEQLHAQARNVAALGAASNAIIDQDRDLSELLWSRFETQLARLRSAVIDLQDGVVGAGAAVPTGRFPAALSRRLRGHL